MSTEILNLVKESIEVDDKSGEVELDISELDVETCWKLRAYIENYKENDTHHCPPSQDFNEVVVNKVSLQNSK